MDLAGLSGRPHPILHNILTTQDAKKARLHLKFLTCDYMTNEKLAKDNPTRSPACDLCPCPAPLDSIEHILVSCRATAEVRARLIPELLNIVAKVQPQCSILQCYPPPSTLTQFILDCTSNNLPDNIRIPAHNPDIGAVYRLSRDFCYAISCERSRLLKSLPTNN